MMFDYESTVHSVIKIQQNFYISCFAVINLENEFLGRSSVFKLWMSYVKLQVNPLKHKTSKKHKNSFSFIPTKTLILNTNLQNNFCLRNEYTNFHPDQPPKLSIWKGTLKRGRERDKRRHNSFTVFSRCLPNSKFIVIAVHRRAKDCDA